MKGAGVIDITFYENFDFPDLIYTCILRSLYNLIKGKDSPWTTMGIQLNISYMHMYWEHGTN